MDLVDEETKLEWIYLVFFLIDEPLEHDSLVWAKQLIKTFLALFDKLDDLLCLFVWFDNQDHGIELLDEELWD